MKKVLLAIFSLLTVLSLTAKTDHLRVVSFNVHLQTPSDTGCLSWDSRKDAAINAIRKLNPDVIGFQEAANYHKLALIGEMPEYQLVDRSGKPGSINQDLKNNENPIMFRADKFELLDYGFFWLNESNQEQIGWDASEVRHATWVKLRFKKSGVIFFVFNTHLDRNGKDSRSHASELLVQNIKTIAGDDAVIYLTGDMNMGPGDADMKALSTYMSDANVTAKKPDPASTVNGFSINPKTGQPSYILTKEERKAEKLNPKKSIQIDHIFFRNSTVKSFQILDDPKFATKFKVYYISTHYPIYSDFDIPIPKVE